MSVWGRLRRIFGTSLHATVSRAEDPVRMVNYQVLEMQESVDRAREEIAKAMAAERRLAMQDVDTHRTAVGWEERARWALAHEDDELAREAIRRKIAAEEMGAYYRRARSQQAQTVSELRLTLERVVALLAQAKARRRALLAHHDAARAQQAAARAVSRVVGSDAAESFERLEEQSRQESSTAMAELVMTGQDTELRFQALEENESVELALHEMKRALGYQAPADVSDDAESEPT